ncbi:MAG: A/G-specific adenine glycosylase [Epsilonproteobacteria bacterium]|nr:A/G-specific adenine glycosylase [Campylobacterota bacterium]
MSSNIYTLLHKNILSWYQEQGRVTLPWRNTQNPYKIYLSEIMLQQTQVKTVLERFYFPFLEKFPTLGDVAHAHQDEILKAWEGLGYYSRARNLHKTAQLSQGELPSTEQELEALPGIGKSTAHAVACFAFQRPLPILDANVKRILYRFFAIEKCNDKMLWEKAYELFDSNNAYIYNQTLMDIGAMVCRHKNPLCGTCPLASMCQGKDSPEQYPSKKSKKKKPTRNKQILIHLNTNKQYALSQNQTRLLHGLWAFPQEELNSSEHPYSTHLGSFTHHYTHFSLEAEVSLSKSTPSTEMQWFHIKEIDDLALSGADRKALALLQKHLQ